MIKRNQFISTLLMLGLLVMATPVLADSDSDSDSDNDQRCRLVGSWQAIVDANPNNIALFTFGKGRTTVASIADGTASTGHGAWKRVGPRSFISKNRAFLFDASGAPSLIATLRDEIELNVDCQSYTSAFETELTLTDGTLVTTVSGTSDGSRIKVD